MLSSLAYAGLVGVTAAGTILWDGRFNDITSSSDLDAWSWSSEVGDYQYYIHGSEDITSYINLDPTYKNPADSGSTQGAKFTLDSTAYWNGQTMRRIELIPQTTAAINSGHVYYHFSMMHETENAPSLFREHQICFFESHFTEMKAGWISGESGTSDPLLRWDISTITQWSTSFDAGVWHNVAYDIDFTAGTVAFWHSTGADDLTLTVPAVSVSASSNGEDWHLGVLELPRDGYDDANEDLYFSGVYIESGTLTTSVAGPGGAVVSSNSSSSSSVVTAATSTTGSGTGTTTRISSGTSTGTSTGAGTGAVGEYAQCGGTSWTGATTCASPFSCVVINQYYSQCQSS